VNSRLSQRGLAFSFPAAVDSLASGPRAVFRSCWRIEEARAPHLPDRQSQQIHCGLPTSGRKSAHRKLSYLPGSAAECSWTSTATRCSSRVVPLSGCVPPIQPFMAASSSITSIVLDDSGSLSSKPTAIIRNDIEKLNQFFVRNNGTRWFRLAGGTKFGARTGPEFITPFQPLSSVQINGAAAPASAPRRPWRRWRTYRKTMPPEMAMTIWAVLQEKKAEQWGSTQASFCCFAGLCLPDSGRLL